jgi:hypothetical protein
VRCHQGKIWIWLLIGVHLVPALFFQPPPALADSAPLRISLAISGGASMGAYEAGLIWGLIGVLRQVENTGAWLPGGEPRPIEIGSMAGTSAGGINTLLAALTWSVNDERSGGFANRIDDNIFRDVWLAPDVNRLLPPAADSPQYLPDDALLSRRVLVDVARELRKKWRRPGTFRPDIRLPLGLTLTRVIPETLFVSGVAVDNQRFYLPFEMQTAKDGSAGFRFAPRDYPSLNDPAMILMPWPADGPPFSISDQQIEDALLTTSAFPIGFGRKRLKYCRMKTFSSHAENTALPAMENTDAGEGEWVCPNGFELAEAEFADGGLFDNLPIGLTRLLSEQSLRHEETPLPIRYIYLDPDRQRYETPVAADKPACQGEDPPDACRQLTYNLASETAVLGGAIGTARKYELYRELTGDNWRLNLSQLSRTMANTLDEGGLDGGCEAELPYFDPPQKFGDSLRQAGRLLELAHAYRLAPIRAPLSASALLRSRIATTCRPPSKAGEADVVAECAIDIPRLRKRLADVLVDVAENVTFEDQALINDIRRSSLSADADRSIYVTTRGGPITGLLLGAFGAFLDYKFREFDYFVGVYDAIVTISANQCARSFPSAEQNDRLLACRDRLSKQLYHLMARREFGSQGGMRFAYDPMPPEDTDIRIIFEGLQEWVSTAAGGMDRMEGVLPAEREFFKHLKSENFSPTPPAGGGTSLLTLIMDDPEYWAHELVNRSTDRLVYLEKEAEAIYKAREPDPQKREQAHTALMGAGSLALRTATYKYPPFTFAPSTAPGSWLWRNLIPYEAAFDLTDGDILLLWQPTWNFGQNNVAMRMGLGFAGGLFNSSGTKNRENYGLLGLDLTRMDKRAFFSGWGITPAVYHNWSDPEDGRQTSFGVDVHANLFKNRVRVSLGTRDVIDDADDTLFLNVGFTDLPGLVYWLSR